MFSWDQIQKPIVALSPMADMTDSAFCRIAKRLGAPIVFREMISSEGLVHGSEKSLEMGAFVPEERPIIQQLFGANPHSMAEATKIIDEAYSPDGFDINMGCPVYKIVSNFNGAALMKEPKLAHSIITSMRNATTKPVSVKVRLGWEKPTEVLDFIKVVEDAGAALVTVHGRTKAQGYSGVADWEMVGRAKEKVNIPVLCNGDVHTPEAAVKALAVSQCDGLLIARGGLGNPWIFGQIAKILAGEPYEEPTFEERLEIIYDHATLHNAQYGNLVSFRKHLSWYSKGIRNGKEAREKLMKITTVDDLSEALNYWKEIKQPIVV